MGSNPGMFHVHIPESERSGESTIGVSAGQAVKHTNFILGQNYPNPFNQGTHISYQLSKADYVLLSIYDLTGKKVMTMVNERQPKGSYILKWNSTDNDGNVVSSGIYFYRIQIDNVIKTRKMLLAK